jgi:hypothetical protein
MQIPAKLRGAPENRLVWDASAFAQGSCGIHFVGWTFVHDHDKGRIDVGFGIEPQTSSSLSGRVPQPTSQPASSQMGARPGSTISVKGTAVRDGTVPAQGLMIVRPGQPRPVVPPPPAGINVWSKAATESAQTNSGGRDSAGQVESQKSDFGDYPLVPRSEYLNWSNSPSPLMSRPSNVGQEFRCYRHRKLGSRE